MNGNTTPHQHLLGAKVSVIDEVKETLKIDWSEGIVAGVFDSEQGVGVHVVNPETGELTEGLRLDAVRLGPDVVKLLESVGIMNARIPIRIGEMFETGTDSLG